MNTPGDIRFIMVSLVIYRLVPSTVTWCALCGSTEQEAIKILGTNDFCNREIRLFNSRLQNCWSAEERITVLRYFCF